MSCSMTAAFIGNLLIMCARYAMIYKDLGINAELPKEHQEGGSFILLY